MPESTSRLQAPLSPIPTQTPTTIYLGGTLYPWAPLDTRHGEERWLDAAFDMPQAQLIEILLVPTFPRGSGKHHRGRTLVVSPDFLALTRYSAAVNDLSFSRGHVALCAPHAIASPTGARRIETPTHRPRGAHKSKQDRSDGHGRRTPRRGYEG
eukprot:6187554-Pleurochrysis_carterae.AAC.4